MKSIWERDGQLPQYDRLDQDISTDVLVIGGGITGILCAYQFCEAGVDCVLVEADRICQGVTKNTTAKITSQHGLIYDKMTRWFGEQTARLYLEANQKALEQYRQLCMHIDCHFEEKDAFVYTKDNPEAIVKEYQALRKLGFPATIEHDIPLPLPSVASLRFPRQAQFHPLTFIRAILSPLRIYEQTPVRKLEGLTAITDHGKIKAKAIVVATHFPFLDKYGLYFLKLYQQRSYVIALENAQDVGGMYVDEQPGGLSFRCEKDLLLLGGGGHRTGKQGGNWAELIAFAHAHYPQARIKYQWATQDCMSLDGLPYIGPYGSHTEGLYVATGFNKWGMTSAMVAANLLCDMVQGKANAYAPIFSPARRILRPQLWINGFETVVSWLTPTTKRCPHLGCALKWNKAEHTWDCPCHGSRFTKEGALIDTPAQRHANVKSQTKMP